MAHFLRGKQAGVQSDFSTGLSPELFAVNELVRYGINSQIVAAAYDPVQSLLAVGTSESPSGGGLIYIFGRKRVAVVLKPSRKCSIRVLHFCADKLVSLSSKHDVDIYSLLSKRLLSSYAPPGIVTALLTDPTLDYALIGLQNGDTIAYDLDRQGLAPFKIPNLWRERNPRARVLPVVSLALHPRDIGKLLIGYSEGAVIFSFKQNKPTLFFHYELQPGAPGGDSDPCSTNSVRHPRIVQALWHPIGTFVLTGHEDSSLVLWDTKDGRLVAARTLQSTNVDRAGTATGSFGHTPGTFALNLPFSRIAWCSKANPDDTGILLAGGTLSTTPDKGLTFLDLGPTPNYATSSWQFLAEHFEKPKSQHLIPTPPNAEVADFLLIPRKSPHYAGSHDPIASIAILSSGELVTLSFPSGHPISPTNQLHVSLTYTHPFVNRIDLALIDRTRWLGMTEKRSHGPMFLNGGAEDTNTPKRFGTRNILQTAHADGLVRLWDAGHGDEVENQDVLQVDVARALGRRFGDVQISKMSMSGTTGELAVGLETGEIIVFRWGQNPNYGRDVTHRVNESFGLEAILDQADPGLKEGLLPLTLLRRQQGAVTAVKLSQIGFVGIGFEAGSVAVIDLRGPAVIYEASLKDFRSKQSKRGSLRGSHGHQERPEWPTAVEFGVMSLENDGYSSILLFIGTNLGRLVTFKLLPQIHGGYSVELAGLSLFDDKIILVSPINADNGSPADATPMVVASLRSNVQVNGVILTVTQSGARIFKPPAAKGANKSWDQFLCDSANVVSLNDHYALLGLFGDGCARAYSIPGLKEIAVINVARIIDVRRFSEAIITPQGEIFGWTGPSEIAVLNIWGTGQVLLHSNKDKLFNEAAFLPPRPTISNIQWLSGTQFVSPSDLDVLIGGPDRPPSKRMIEQMRSEEQQRQQEQRTANRGTSSSAAPGREEEGYWAYMQRQVQERTENLGIMGDNMEKLEENSSGWANDVNKFIGQQKRKMVLGAIGSKFGF